MKEQHNLTMGDYDYIVIGSGFGGSVSAMRLAEKGYSVLVLEKGKRWAARDFPKTNWNLRKYLWIPLLRFFGFLKLDFFSQVFVLSGVGVGGGSLVYANTHMMPKEPFYHHPGWKDLADWKKILPAFFEKARFMLGSSRYEKTNVEDDVLAEVARDLGRENTYSRVDYVGVYLGDPGRSTDPYFSGLGPMRKGCTECAGCMVGCRHEAKNTLDKNYLWFAEKMFDATIEPETEVKSIEFSEKDSTYSIKAHQGLGLRKKEVMYKSKGVVVSAGVLGTLRLLLNQKHVLKTMPGLSDSLGENLMTNSEMLSGVVAADRKLNHGLAISSIFDPDEDTHIELVKFPDHSGSMLRLAVQAAGPGSPPVRFAKMLGNILLHPWDFLRSVLARNPARNSVILLIMQTLHSSMKMGIRKGLTGWKLFIRQEKGGKVPSYIQSGQDVLYRYAKKVNGVPQNAITEVTFGLSSTAHILGGCRPGSSPETSVVDHQFRVHGYPNMMILDGSIVPCNLGVNPSLTITALSEYAMSCVPPKDGVKVDSLDKRLAERQLQPTH
ncbi:MAG: GMC family oxidoreductase [Bacteroidetes bacterium]|nr:GMC family oxidoreductase [Bacteroidota bacterium]